MLQRVWSTVLSLIICLEQILLNVVAGGVTPNFTAKEAEALGAKLISSSTVLLCCEVPNLPSSLSLDYDCTSDSCHARIAAVP